MNKNKYRIIRDSDFGYTVQTKKWWFPFFWFECFDSRCGYPFNSHYCVDDAKDFIELHKNYKSTRIVYEE